MANDNGYPRNENIFINFVIFISAA